MTTSDQVVIEAKLEEALWKICAESGRVLHALHLIRAPSTPEEYREQLRARLPEMLRNAGNALMSVSAELETLPL